jgi:esterase/lipase superfamily enzyme
LAVTQRLVSLSDDAENIQASVGQIRSFLEQIAKESNAESINLVAHSMGSVGLSQALAACRIESLFSIK